MGVAVGATTVSTALITGTTITVAPPEVTLAALVTPANSTSQIFAGKVYYGEDQTDVYGEQIVVPFFLGPRGIVWAVKGLDDEVAPHALFASGWGAGQASTALALMDEDDLDNLDVVVLDNNTNRAGGGFWTTYAVFAPLLFTSAKPTPTDLPVQVIDVAYQYNINSNAPTNPLNLFATANSLVAYVYGYGGEQTAAPPDWDDPATPDVETEPTPGTHYVVHPGTGKVIATHPVEVTDEKKPPTIIYVTYVSEDLPLLRPLRSIPGGEPVADALEPTVTRLVEAGYADGQSIPEDPSVPRPMDLSLWGQQSQEVTSGPSAEARVAGKLAGLHGEGRDLLDAATIHEKPNELLRGPIYMTSGNTAATTTKAGNTSSTGEANKPVRRVVDRLRSAGSDARESLGNAKNDARQGGIGKHRRSEGES